MFEVWVDELNPSLHLVKKPGTPLPDANAMVPWSLLGTVAVTPAIAAMVEQAGAAEVISVVPFDPQGVFGPAGAPSGEQNNLPR